MTLSQAYVQELREFDTGSLEALQKLAEELKHHALADIATCVGKADERSAQRIYGVLEFLEESSRRVTDEFMRRQAEGKN